MQPLRHPFTFVHTAMLALFCACAFTAPVVASNAIGFRTLELLDPSRATHTGEARQPRRLSVRLWYPAAISPGGHAFPQRNYFGTDEPSQKTRIDGVVSSNSGCLASDVAWRALEAPALAIANAAHAPAAHAMVLVSGEVDPWLAESLAGHGFVVTSVMGEDWGYGVEDAVDDVLLVQREAAAWPFVTKGSRAVLGTGYHGLIAALAALRSGMFDAVVSIDGAEAWADWGPQTFDLPYAQAPLLRAPWLRFHDNGRSAQTVDKRPFWDAAYSSDRHEITFDNPRNLLQLPVGLLAGLCPTDAASARTHAVLGQTTAGFLRHTLAGGKDIAWQPVLADGSIPRHQAWPTRAPLPAIAEAVRLLADGKHTELLAQLQLLHVDGGTVPAWYWSEILSPSFNAGDTDTAAVIADEYLRQQPASASAHYLKAVVSTQQGRLQDAATHYERCLALARDADVEPGPGGYRIERSYLGRATKGLQRVRERLQAQSPHGN